MIGYNIDNSSPLAILEICNKPWSAQLKDVVIASVINVICLDLQESNKV